MPMRISLRWPRLMTLGHVSISDVQNDSTPTNCNTNKRFVLCIFCVNHGFNCNYFNLCFLLLRYQADRGEGVSSPTMCALMLVYSIGHILCFGFGLFFSERAVCVSMCYLWVESQHEQTQEEDDRPDRCQRQLSYRLGICNKCQAGACTHIMRLKKYLMYMYKKCACTCRYVFQICYFCALQHGCRLLTWAGNFRNIHFVL